MIATSRRSPLLKVTPERLAFLRDFLDGPRWHADEKARCWAVSHAFLERDSHISYGRVRHRITDYGRRFLAEREAQAEAA